MNSRYKGIFFITLSALSFAFMNAFVRLSGDLPSVQKSFFRNLVAFFIALIMIIRSKDGFKIEKGNLKYMILRATFGTVGILCNFYAVDHLVLSDASMLNKMSPFFVIIFSFLLLKEKMSPAQALAVAGAFIGSLFVIKPTFTNMALVPSLIGLCGGICAGIAYAMVRILGQRGQKGSSVVIFFSGFSCVVTLPYLLLDFHPMSGLQILTLLGAGLAAAGGQFGITAAYYHAPAKEISIYDYSQIIFSTILGWEYYGEKSLEYLIKAPIAVTIYRLFYSLVAFVGATTALQIVWDFSDTMNGLMIIPNLICLLWLNKDVAKECFEYQDAVVVHEKNGEEVDYQEADKIGI